MLDSRAFLEHSATDWKPVQSHGAPLPAWKRGFDICCALVLLPLLAVVAAGLICVNPFLNAGPLIYTQCRMGYANRPFYALKFRTMRQGDCAQRGAFAGLECGRITRLGRWLRAVRLDELPQIINVLKREMSMIGPRPHYYAHAAVYLRDIPAYHRRGAVLPGISGLAQTEVGYAQTVGDLRKMVAADVFYTRKCSLRLDLWIGLRTIRVILRGAGQ